MSALVNRLFSWAKKSFAGIQLFESHCGVNLNVSTERIVFKAPRPKKYADAEVQTEVSEHKVTHATYTDQTSYIVDSWEAEEKKPEIRNTVECEVEKPRKFGFQSNEKNTKFSFHDNWKSSNAVKRGGSFNFRSLEQKVVLPEHKISRKPAVPVMEAPTAAVEIPQPKSESDNRSAEYESEQPASESSELEGTRFSESNSGLEIEEEEESYESDKQTDSSDTESNSNSREETTESE